MNMTRSDGETLDKSLGLLLLDVGHLFRKRFGERLAREGFTGAESRALMHLSASEGISQARLAERLFVTPITLARLFDRLEEAGLAERRADPGDRRINQLHLTSRGRKVVARIRHVASEMSDDLIERLPAREIQKLEDSLLHLRTVLKEG
jgi:MarR family transcriptional regulator for hemolysin